MGEPAIRMESLGKCYRIGAARAHSPIANPVFGGYRTLRETVADAFASAWQRARTLVRLGGGDLMRRGEDVVWALRDISLEIGEGEVVGIIGRNGAGKTTLLKVLSRITEPSTGYAEVRGRVGSLLEVGTGFHPELTGAENIYLSGAILGMKRAEIAQKFDEIVAFSEVERFLETPVKHYSSGMYLRLAFAVAAHLEPEILLVDEVLAVGDAQFQKKCLNKMGDIGNQGRTVLFVSHNMPAVTRLCERTILLDEGRIIRDGPSSEVVGAYLNSGVVTAASREWSAADAPGGDVARLRAVRVRAADGTVTETVDVRDAVQIEMEYEVLKPGHVLLPHYDLLNDEGVLIFVTLDQDPTWRGRKRPTGWYRSVVTIPGNLLAEGRIFVTAILMTLNPAPAYQFCVYDAVALQVVDMVEGDSARGDWAGHLGGVVRPLLPWTTEFHPADARAAQVTFGKTL
jgi:lipopolysaccharide transport system ATP-binding protein